MIYLGSSPIGILSGLPQWGKVNSITFSEYSSYNGANDFFNNEEIFAIFNSLEDGRYKIEFVNNTTTTRAGLWIEFVKKDNTWMQVSVMRVGMGAPASISYGVDVYANAQAIFYKYMPWGGWIR